MKRAIAFGLFVNAALLVGILLKKEVVVHAAAGAGGGVPTRNGDVNGDGTIDISDAVYTLGWLFGGGAAPIAIDCQAGGGKVLSATGQTKCYQYDVDHGAWIEAPCNQATCRGQDGVYKEGFPLDGRFTDNGNGTVTDHFTGLMWQKLAADVNGDGRFDGEDAIPWCDALAYCENLNFAGHNDWRLPNVRELQSIADYGRDGPSINPVFGGWPTPCWSSTSHACCPNETFTLDLFGDESLMDKFSIVWVRAVRNAQ